MTSLDFTVPPPDPTRPEREPRRSHRHDYGLIHRYGVARWEAHSVPCRLCGPTDLPVAGCIRCGAAQDPARSRRGKSNDRFGKDQERRIERVYGLRKVGEFGDAIDLLGKTTKWQSRATRGAIPQWLAAVTDGVRPIHFEAVPAWITRPFHAMEELFPARMPVLIRPVVRHGHRTVDYIVVRGRDWYEWHGAPFDAGYVVMRGETWLAIHGREGA